MIECSFCGRRAVYHERAAGVYRCDRCLVESVEKKFRSTISEYELIKPGDKVISAVSGGRDSLSCLRLLADYSEYRDVEVIALTIDEGISGYRDGGVKQSRNVAGNLGVVHRLVRFKDIFGKSLDEMAELSNRIGGPDTCTLCGILRRSLLNQASRELGADKLAIAHNLDDVVQTVLLNYLRGDLSRLYRLKPKSGGREGFVPRIKPLREIPEKEVAIYSMLRGLGGQASECPYIGGMRSEVRSFLNEMEWEHPTTKFRVLRMFDRIRPHLPVNPEDVELGECEICGEPSTGDLCRACELLDSMNLKREKSLIFE